MIEESMCGITREEIQRLRELARKQREYAELPVMAKRAEQWRRNNDGLHAIPPIVVETWTFDPDFMPESVFTCQSPKARKMEYHLLKNIREYELLGDDKVMPGFYPVNWKIDIDWFGIKAGSVYAADSKGREIGFSFEAPIKDLERDFHLLKPVSVKLRREETEREKNFIEEVLDGILPVKIRGEICGLGLTAQAVSLCGMENLWIFLVDCPGAAQEFMKYLTANHHALLDFYEKENLLTSTSDNSDIGQSSYGFTSRLPGKAPGTYKLKDVWMFTEMEETSSVSPEMFREFFLPCNESLCSRVGAVYYGCCEPMQNTFPAIYEAIPNLRKLSISAFSDEQKMGELLQNTGIVYSRKPRPNYLGVAKSLDEEAWRGHIADTFRAARGGPCEIIMRDIYQVPSLESVRRAVEIAREEAQKFYG
jgi:hypothetical protein